MKPVRKHGFNVKVESFLSLKMLRNSLVLCHVFASKLYTTRIVPERNLPSTQLIIFKGMDQLLYTCSMVASLP